MLQTAAKPVSPFEEIEFSARDGLRLYARRYGNAPPAANRRTVLCLAGLTRNSRDFHDVALALSTNPQSPRTVYTLDTRGRGRSAFDPEPKNYVVPIELQDVIDLATMAGLSDLAMLGTSRGGLISMFLAAAQPGLVGSVILNDIGPVIEREGLARIAGYVGRAPLPNSWADAARMVRDMNVRQFPNLPDTVWMELAHQFFNEKDGRPSVGYDAKIAQTFSVLDGPMPQLWPQFEAMKRCPVMVIRGEHSDILSAATVEEMKRRHPALAALTVNGQGHAPLLKDKPTIESIRRFLDAADLGQVVTGMSPL